MVKFSIITATYNRGDLLKDIYKALIEQTLQDFEWIIIDDGSSDGTKEIVSRWEKRISIKYIWQTNQGKHVAINNGIKKAEGRFVIILDADDIPEKYALQHFKSYLEERIFENDNCAGVAVLCSDASGKLIGTKFLQDKTCGNLLDLYYRQNVKGDKWMCWRKNVIEDFPFPVIEGEKFMPEAIVWNRISLKYKIFCANDSLLRIRYQADGLSSSSKKIRIKNPKGASLYYKEFVNLMSASFGWKLRNIINYSRFSFHAKNSVSEQINGINSAIMKIILVLILPLGFCFYLRDKSTV